MRFTTRLLSGFAVLLATGVFAEDLPEEPVSPEEIFAQLPADLADNYIDPLTVEKRPAFAGGEHLTFRLGWSFFTVAHAELKVEPGDYPALGLPAIHITMNTRTNSFADAFYKVRNESWSWIAEDASRSFEYGAIQRESDRNRDVLATFDPVTLTGLHHNRLKDEKTPPVGILPGTFDPLGIVFFVRSLQFDVGDELVIPTSNGKEFFFTIVRVTEIVERRFAIGKRRAYVIEPDIKDVGGVFKRSKDGNIRFYFSADAQKLPLRMESSVSVGKFWAELTEFRALTP